MINYILMATTFIAFWTGILGLFKPDWTLFYMENKTRKMSSAIYFGTFIGCFLLGMAIAPKTQTPETPVIAATPKKLNCNLPFKILHQNGNQFYVSVKGFDTKNADCWAAIEDFIKGREDFIIHFVDATEFEPSPLTAEKQKLVVAQWVKQLGLVADPFGFGIYTK